MPTRTHTSAALGLMLIIAPARASEETPEGPTPEQTAWVREHAIPVRTVEAGNGLNDLAPLAELIGEARVVALGETTHGSREQFQMKHRLLEYLVEEVGFSVFSIEANMPESYEVNRYVVGGEGDPSQLIKGMYFWTWATEEVLTMVEWMYDANAESREKGLDPVIRFTGFDMQFPKVAAKIAQDSAREHDSEFADRVATLYETALNVTSQAPASITDLQLDAGSLAGKTVRVTGRMRTIGVNEGWAGVWVRADKNGVNLLIDNMQIDGPRFTTPWADYDAEIDIPADADSVTVGTLLVGPGTLLVDDFRILADGEPVELPDALASGFDVPIGTDATATGLIARGNSAKGKVIDDEEQGRCLSIATIDDGMSTPAEALKAAGDAYALFQAEAQAMAESLGERDAAWAVQNARIVAQHASLQTAAGMERLRVRDRAMADNLLWILEQDPDARVVIWAHNGHVHRNDPWMGMHLDEALGDDYYAIGFNTESGRYRAHSPRVGGRGGFDLLDAPPLSVARILGSAGPDLLILPLKASREDDPGSGWAHEPRPFRHIGALETNYQFQPARVAQLYDALMFTRETTDAVPLP
ncbi:MAG: erythromycin esterase family protein [Planctomycetota bacterium]